MAKSLGCEIATPKRLDFRAEPIGVEEEIAVATVHERGSQTHKADSVIAQIMGFPATLRKPRAPPPGKAEQPVVDVTRSI